MNLPWSQTFYLCCQDVCSATLGGRQRDIEKTNSQIRSFIQKFYQFLEGVSQHHRDIDELLSNVRSSPSLR
jgi:hypothetical protein